MNRALVLFAHGSRDPGWTEPFESLGSRLRARLPEVRVEQAYLELTSPSLPQLVESLVEEGVGSITVVPVFLAQGRHLRHDLPAMIETLRAAYPEHSIEVTAPIGEQAEVLSAIAECIARLFGD